MLEKINISLVYNNSIPYRGLYFPDRSLIQVKDYEDKYALLHETGHALGFKLNRIKHYTTITQIKFEELVADYFACAILREEFIPRFKRMWELYEEEIKKESQIRIQNYERIMYV